jgi:Glycosyl hydrolases family 25
VTLRGSDVSRYQSAAQVAAACQWSAFVFVKATQGAASTDPDHDAHVATIRGAGSLVGHYHFASDVTQALAESEHFLSVAQSVPGDALALDLEATNGTWIERATYAAAWLDMVRAATGARPLLYVNGYWLSGIMGTAPATQRIILASYPLWIATAGKPAGQPGINGWTMHQYSTGGGIDHDILADGVAWGSFAVPPVLPPMPTPTPEDDDDMWLVRATGTLDVYKSNGTYKMLLTNTEWHRLGSPQVADIAATHPLMACSTI